MSHIALMRSVEDPRYKDGRERMDELLRPRTYSPSDMARQLGLAMDMSQIRKAGLHGGGREGRVIE